MVDLWYLVTWHDVPFRAAKWIYNWCYKAARYLLVLGGKTRVLLIANLSISSRHKFLSNFPSFQVTSINLCPQLVQLLFAHHVCSNPGCFVESPSPFWGLGICGTSCWASQPTGLQRWYGSISWFQWLYDDEGHAIVEVVREFWITWSQDVLI